MAVIGTGIRQWGRALRGRAGVHVVSTVDEVAVALEVTQPLPGQLEAFLPTT